MTKATRWIMTSAAAVAVAGLLFTVPAMAQGTSEPTTPAPWAGQGPMTGKGLGRFGRTAPAPMAGMGGIMHDQVQSQLAEKLGMTLEELEQARANGKTVADLAAEQGITAEELRSVMTEAMKAALASAVESGTLTQEQADAMLQRHEQKSGGCLSGAGPGMMGQGGGMMGRGMMGQGGGMMGRRMMGPGRGMNPGEGMGQGWGWRANSQDQ